MDDIHVALSIIGGLLTALTIVIGWLGSRVIIRLDDLNEKLDDAVFNTHTKINILENRIVRLEVLSKA